MNFSLVVNCKLFTRRSAWEDRVLLYSSCYPALWTIVGLVAGGNVLILSCVWGLGWCSLSRLSQLSGLPASGLLVTVPQSQCLLTSLCHAIAPCVLVGKAEILSCAVSPRRSSKTISCPEDAKLLERQSLVDGASDGASHRGVNGRLMARCK